MSYCKSKASNLNIGLHCLLRKLTNIVLLVTLEIERAVALQGKSVLRMYMPTTLHVLFPSPGLFWYWDNHTNFVGWIAATTWELRQNWHNQLKAKLCTNVSTEMDVTNGNQAHFDADRKCTSVVEKLISRRLAICKVQLLFMLTVNQLK